jgi:hypothetical protein
VEWRGRGKLRKPQTFAHALYACETLVNTPVPVSPSCSDGFLGFVLVDYLSYCFRSLAILALALVPGFDIASIPILASVFKPRTPHRDKNLAGSGV